MHSYIGVTQHATHKLILVYVAIHLFLNLLLPLASLKRLGSKNYDLMQLKPSAISEANTKTVSYKKADILTCFRS